MSLTIKGKLYQVLPVESGVSRAGNSWKKQLFVIETNDQFPRKVCFTLFNDKVALLEPFSPGEELEVAFNLESREYNGRWFSDINAWKIDGAGSRGNSVPPPPPFEIGDIPPERADEGSDDLPF